MQQDGRPSCDIYSPVLGIIASQVSPCKTPFVILVFLCYTALKNELHTCLPKISGRWVWNVFYGTICTQVSARNFSIEQFLELQINTALLSENGLKIWRVNFWRQNFFKTLNYCLTNFVTGRIMYFFLNFRKLNLNGRHQMTRLLHQLQVKIPRGTKNSLNNEALASVGHHKPLQRCQSI